MRWSPRLRAVLAVTALVSTSGTAYALSAGCAADGLVTYGSTAARYAGALPVTLVNTTGVPLCGVQMGPSTDGQWGDDWLAPGASIMPGGEQTFPTRGDPLWDVRVFDCGDNVVRYRLQIPLAGPTRITLHDMMPAPGGASVGGGYGSTSGGAAPPSGNSMSGSLYGR